MPDYRFVIEGGTVQQGGMVFDLSDASIVGVVAKHAARHLASREMGYGRLDMARDLTVLDADNVLVARYPLRDFIRID